MPLRPSATFPVLLLVMACGESQPLAPEAPLLSQGQNGFQVVTLHVGADLASNSTSRISGPLQIRLGTRYPPNPCLPNPGPPDAPVLGVCGVLHNPDGETLTGGEFRVGDSRTGQVLRFQLSAPPNPCTRLFLTGSLNLAGVLLPDPGPPEISATFTTQGGQLLGTWANPGPPDVGINPGPPGVGANPGPPTVCTATISTPRDG